jgi:hypothetical protein
MSQEVEQLSKQQLSEELWCCFKTKYFLQVWFYSQTIYNFSTKGRGDVLEENK